MKLLTDSGIVVSAGHTDSTFSEAMNAFDKGITAGTHLFNAMSPLHHRQPGLVGAAFQHPAARFSIIPDGFHVDFAAIAIAKKAMGERLFAITDAVTTTIEGPYQHELVGDKYECNGTLSGSALSMHKAFKNLVKSVGIDAGEAARMCSLYPAQVLRVENRYGRLAAGYAAKAIVLNKEYDIETVLY
jgi:N-acetylglucosamine-6-phosphate deacetylase